MPYVNEGKDREMEHKDEQEKEMVRESKMRMTVMLTCRADHNMHDVPIVLEH